MTQPLMPKATAVWLIENTALTFEQVAEFCQLHALEVQAIADGEVGIGMQGFDPIANGQLSRDEIQRCAADPSARLELQKSNLPKCFSFETGIQVFHIHEHHTCQKW